MINTSEELNRLKIDHNSYRALYNWSQAPVGTVILQGSDDGVDWTIIDCTIDGKLVNKYYREIKVDPLCNRNCEFLDRDLRFAIEKIDCYGIKNCGEPQLK